VRLIPYLCLGALLLLVALVSVYRRQRVRTIRDLPLTPLDAFRTPEARLEPGVLVRPRLSRLGRAAVVFAVVFGVVGVAVTLAALYGISSDHGPAADRHATAAPLVGPAQRDKRHIVRHRSAADVPRAVRMLALLPAALIDIGVITLLWSLRRHLLLVRSGRLTTAHVVGIVGYGRGAVAYYDFPDDQGGVTRGSSSLQFPLSGQIFAGAALPLLYMPGNPQFNRLKTALLWEVPDRYEVV
jgi:hypothetical protein